MQVTSNRRSVFSRTSLRGLGLACVLAAAAGLATNVAQAQVLSTGITYQGELNTGGSPATGSHDFRFRLYNASVAGAQQGPTLGTTANVNNGLFTVELDFGNVYNNNDMWIEIDVRPTGPGAYTTLAPRQRLTASPFANFARGAEASNTANSANTANTATNALALNSQAASFYTNASNMSTGTLPNARLSGGYTNVLNLTNAANTFTGTFTGTGTALTGLNASNISSGTLADARLSANVDLLNLAQTFTANKTFNSNVGIGTAPSGSYPFQIADTGGYSVRIDNNGGAGFAGGVYVVTDSTSTQYGYLSDLNGSGSTSYNHWANNSSAGGRGFYAAMLDITGGGAGTTPSYGVYITNAGPAGYGGYFNNTNTTTTLNTYGLWAENNSPGGYGLYALHDAATGTGKAVYAETDSGDAGSYAIHGKVDDAASVSTSAAIRAENTGPGYALYATSQGGNALYATTTGESSGIYCTTQDGEAVYAIASPTTATEICYGGYFSGGNSSSSRGVYGTVSGAGIGVYGYSTGGYGGYFDTGVSGGPALYVVGTASVGVITIRGGADLAENFEFVQDASKVEPGMVVMIDEDHVGGMELAVGAYNKKVAGVISGANDLEAGMTLGNFEGMTDPKPVALTGRVWTYVDASEKAVEPGDLLTTSNTPGYAMPVVEQSMAHGATIGKAMSKLEKGQKGMVLVLVNLQ